MKALRGTPTGIVAMGTSDHHQPGAERHLRDVPASFGAPVVPVAGHISAADFVEGAPGPRAAGELDAVIDGTLALAGALRGVPVPAGAAV